MNSFDETQTTLGPTFSHSRREFLAGVSAAGAALCTAPSTLLAQNTASARWPIAVFTKPFQELSPDDTADLIAEVGWDGIECPVRKGGQVLPERVEEDLPKMVAALKKRGKALLIMATDVKNATDPATTKVLRVASQLGVRYYRLGMMKYAANRSIPDQLKELRPQLRDLAALNKELGLCGGIQNHSGPDYIGGPVWDIYELIRDLDPKQLGVFFDIGHATIEGGNVWQLHARLMEPRFGSVFVKDFTWQKRGNSWRTVWCPIGEGTIQRSFFDRLKKSRFAGPICHHLEYELGTGAARLELLKRDLATLKRWLG